MAQLKKYNLIIAIKNLSPKYKFTTQLIEAIS
jgi:hypothetical protein